VRFTFCFLIFHIIILLLLFLFYKGSKKNCAHYLVSTCSLFFSFWPAVSYLLDFFQYLAVLLVLMILFPLSFNFEDAVGILELVYSILFHGQTIALYLL